MGKDGTPVRATKLFHSGDHPTLKLRTEKDYEITGTHNHPVLCLESVAGVPMLLWKLLEEITPGTFVVLDRHAPDELGLLSEREWKLATLAGAWVSEGFASENRAGFNNLDKEYFDAVVDAYDEIVGGPRYVYERTIRSGSLLYELDVQNMISFRSSPLGELTGKAAEKRVPEFVWSAGPSFKQAFLHSLFEGDGSCSLLGRNTIQVCYSTRSKQLAQDVQSLLLELGVVSRISNSCTRRDQGGYLQPSRRPAVRRARWFLGPETRPPHREARHPPDLEFGTVARSCAVRC